MTAIGRADVGKGSHVKYDGSCGMLSFRYTERGCIAMAVLSPRAELVDPSQPHTAIPRLENGDCLSRAEFERR